MATVESESDAHRDGNRCTVRVGFRDQRVVLRPEGPLDAVAADLLIELVRAAEASGVEVSVDLTGGAA